MSNSYIPIPSSSDNEEDSTPMSEDENSESPRGYPYVPILTNPDTDIEESEEEPEEDTTNNSWEDNRTLPSSSAPLYSFEVSAPPRQTARMRVATPERVTLSSDHNTAPNQHQTDTEYYFNWDLTLKTLREWRDIALGRPNYEQGETSGQQEPLLDTTPIIVEKMLSHENRMDLLEDVIIHLPEPEAYDSIENHLTYTGEEMMGLKKEVQQLTVQLKSTDLKIQHMDRQMDKLIWQANQAELMRMIDGDTARHAIQKEQQKKDNN